MQDDFEPAGGMKIGPEGFQGAPDPVTYPKDPPRLCQAGPCVNYHTMTTQLDAQEEMGAAGGGGVFHTEQHHYCYPTVGIESNLGSMPVLACNKWAPIAGLFRSRRSVAKKYAAELEQWQVARAANAIDAEVDDPEVSVQVNLIRSSRSVGFTASYLKTMSLGDVLLSALRDGHHKELGLDVGAQWTVEFDRSLIDNKTATLLELGAADGASLVFTFSPEPTT